MLDVSAYGTTVIVIALNSFPVGFSISEFTDDVSQPLIIEPTETTGYEILYDGKLFFYDKGAPIKVSVSVIPESRDDINLKVLLQARKGAPSLIPLPDVTSMVITYPDGGRIVLSYGSIISGPFGTSLASSGRRAGNTYTFVFGAVACFQSMEETGATLVRGGLDLLHSFNVI